jgi:hypothetical protein
MTPDYLPIAVRAWVERDGLIVPRDLNRRKQRPARQSRWPQAALVIDCETTTDAAQQLNFGSYRYYRVSKHGRRTCMEEGLFYADNLPERDPRGFAVLKEYARTRSADVASGASPRLRLMSRRQFVKEVLYPAAYKARALLVGFNLPFDLARVASGWGEARGMFAGGISLALSDYLDADGTWHENRYRPRIVIKTIDSKRALKGFARPAAVEEAEQIPDGATDGQPDRTHTFRGHFQDLRTLVFALTNESHTLESACRAFGVEHGKLAAPQHGVITPEYIDYNRRDVQATAELLEKLRAEYDRHPIALPVTQAYSPASIGKAYPRAMGIPPILERQPDFPREVLGYAMTAFYGGRAECRIRGISVPVVYCDFLSMYPTVNALMGLWDFLTAERIEVVDDTERVQRLLDGITLEDCFEQETWREFPVLVQLQPEGDILPGRAQYDGAGSAWQIGVNPLHADVALWYALPDAVAAKLLTGRAPRVLRALRLVPVGKQAGLRPVDLRGAVRVDPRTQDFFRVVIEERKRLDRRTDLSPAERKRLDQFLKVLANSAVYGIYAEMIRRQLPAGERAAVTVYCLDSAPFDARVAAPEEPGEFCFPPLAACITAAARLMLAMLERCVSDAGGTHAFCDTDSMGIVATEHGGLVPCPGGPQHLSDGREAIRALSWAEVEAIRDRFAALNPYDEDPYDPAVVPGSILKVEDENFDEARQRRQLYCYAISAKRYALYNLDADGRPVLRKWSEHGLGHLLNPTDPDSEDREWIRQCWEYIVCRDALGVPAAEPSWLDRPAMSRITASTPEVLRPFREYNEGKPYAEQVKPWNFLLSAHVAPFGHPDGVDPRRFHLVARYKPDPRQWRKVAWIDLYSAARYRISTTGDAGGPGVARVKTYRDVLAEYRNHPEAKFLGPDGVACGRATRGLLQRRSVWTRADLITYIGKEANKVEDRQKGLVHDQTEVLTQYHDPRRDPWRTLVVPVLRDVPRAQLAQAAGIHPRAVAALRNGHTLPRPQHRAALTQAAADFARGQLRAWGVQAPHDQYAACATYLHERAKREYNSTTSKS